MIEAIGAWLVTVAGSAMLFGLFDMLLPSSSVRSFTRAMMGLVMMAIILSPLMRWAGDAVNWPTDVQRWLTVGADAASQVDWKEATALQEAGRRVAIQEAKERWEQELSGRLEEVGGVERAAITSVWGETGPSEVGVRVWPKSAPSEKPTGSAARVESPVPVAPLNGTDGAGKDPPDEAGGGRAPPRTEPAPISLLAAEPGATGGRQWIETRVQRIVQAVSGLPRERIHVQLVAEE